MIHSISCKTSVNQISWLSLSRVLRGGDQGWVTFGGGGEKVLAQAWDLALPGVLASHRAAWQLVRLRRGWGSPHNPYLDQCTRLCKAPLQDSPSEEKPILTPGPSTLPLRTPCHANSDAWHAFPNALVQIHLAIMWLSICPHPLGTASEALMSPAKPLPSIQGSRKHFGSIN